MGFLQNNLFLGIELKIIMLAGTLFLTGVVILLVVTRLSHNQPLVKELWTLYLTEFIIVGMIVGPTLMGRAALAVGITLLGLAALREFYATVAPSLLPVLKWAGGIAGLGVFVTAYRLNSVTGLYGITVLIGAGLLGVYIFLPVAPEMPHQLGLILLGVVYPCLFLAHILLLSKIPQGWAYIIFLYSVMEIFDTFALFFGKLFGRKKIFFRLSPQKTYAGVLGGAIMALLMAVIVGSVIFEFSWPTVLNGALLVIIFTVLGDLLASKLKRDAGVKDFGNVLPRQGGVLDIYDSLIFTAPAFFMYVQLFEMT